MIPYIVLIIAVSGIIAGAVTIAVAEFGDTMDPCFNSTYGLMTTRTINNFERCNATTTHTGSAGVDGLNLSDEYYTKTQSQSGLANITEQIPTVAIIAAMVIIISVIAGVFIYFKAFR